MWCKYLHRYRRLDHANFNEGADFAPWNQEADEHISRDVDIVTDEWNGYIPIKADYPNPHKGNPKMEQTFLICLSIS